VPIRNDSGVDGWGELSDFPGRGHGLEHTRDNLCGAGAGGRVLRFDLEQLGVGQGGAQLVVQLMKQRSQVRGVPLRLLP
jgi:hypothetical protein